MQTLEKVEPAAANDTVVDLGLSEDQLKADIAMENARIAEALDMETGEDLIEIVREASENINDRLKLLEACQAA